MATITQTGGQTTSVRRMEGYPAGGVGFDWAYVLLSALFIAGLWVDGWAHFHGLVDDSFFTPWHFLFYSAFGLVALFTGWHQWRNVQKRHAFTQALPVGYWLSLLGVALFACGGLGDMIWHTLFGIESGSEALTSPTHILLAIGMALVFTGPLRAAWVRPGGRGWRELGPSILAMTMVFAMAAFFTSYANPTIQVHAMNFGRGETQDLGVIAVLWQAALLAGAVLLLVARWRLPFGAFTLMFGLHALLMTLLNDFFAFIPGAMLAGLIADVLVLWLRPSLMRPNAFYAFAYIVPAVYYALYFAALEIVIRVTWSIHVWSGAVFLAGMTGLLVSFLLTAGRQNVQVTEVK